MSSRTLYYYKIYCNTDGQYEYIWSDTSPTVCPVNNTHSVNLSSVSIEDQISENIVKIKEEHVPTGENFMSENVCIQGETGPDVWTQNDFSFPFPISVMSVKFVSTDDHYLDQVNTCVGPNTIIGAIGASCPTGATGCVVSSTVIDNMMIGYSVNLFDGSTSEDVGRCLDVDSNTSTITWETPTTQSFSPLTPTYVRMTVYTVNNYVIGPASRYVIGEDKIGGSYVPTNTLVRVGYKNNSNYAKVLYVQIEYLY